MTGVNCDKAIDVDYDLRFYDPLLPATAALSIPFKFSSKALSLSLWVKFDAPFSRGTVITVYNSKYTFTLKKNVHFITAFMANC